MNNELENIKERYDRRKKLTNRENYYYIYHAKSERELVYFQILKIKFENFESLKLLEIGAGTGDNILAFKRFNFCWENLYANELLPERIDILKNNLKTKNIYPGDACELQFNDCFDIVFQSTVFTSILNLELKIKLAQKMYNMTKNKGLIIWYDFKYNNPRNKDVKGITKKEIRSLFPNANKINFHNVTLAPPIGRKFGKYYYLVNKLFPYLRTHIIAEIHK